MSETIGALPPKTRLRKVSSSLRPGVKLSRPGRPAAGWRDLAGRATPCPTPRHPIYA